MEKPQDTSSLLHSYLSPRRAVEVASEGLCAVAKPGDHVARELSSGCWHHGIFAGQNPNTTMKGDFLVIDSSPNASGGIRSCSLGCFMGQNPVKAAIVCYNGDEEQGRIMALYEAQQMLQKCSERCRLPGDIGEAFATLCWTGGCEPFTDVSRMLASLRTVGVSSRAVCRRRKLTLSY